MSYTLLDLYNAAKEDIEHARTCNPPFGEICSYRSAVVDQQRNSVLFTSVRFLVNLNRYGKWFSPLRVFEEVQLCLKTGTMRMVHPEEPEKFLVLPLTTHIPLTPPPDWLTERSFAVCGSSGTVDILRIPAEQSSTMREALRAKKQRKKNPPQEVAPQQPTTPPLSPAPSEFLPYTPPREVSSAFK